MYRKVIETTFCPEEPLNPFLLHSNSHIFYIIIKKINSTNHDSGQLNFKRRVEGNKVKKNNRRGASFEMEVHNGNLPVNQRMQSICIKYSRLQVQFALFLKSVPVC